LIAFQLFPGHLARFPIEDPGLPFFETQPFFQSPSLVPKEAGRFSGRVSAVRIFHNAGIAENLDFLDKPNNEIPGI
jgi:hypothetical protein